MSSNLCYVPSVRFSLYLCLSLSALFVHFNQRIRYLVFLFLTVSVCRKLFTFIHSDWWRKMCLHFILLITCQQIRMIGIEQIWIAKEMNCFFNSVLFCSLCANIFHFIQCLRRSGETGWRNKTAIEHYCYWIRFTIRSICTVQIHRESNQNWLRLWWQLWWWMRQLITQNKQSALIAWLFQNSQMKTLCFFFIQRKKKRWYIDCQRILNIFHIICSFFCNWDQFFRTFWKNCG